MPLCFTGELELYSASWGGGGERGRTTKKMTHPLRLDKSKHLGNFVPNRRINKYEY